LQSDRQARAEKRPDSGKFSPAEELWTFLSRFGQRPGQKLSSEDRGLSGFSGSLRDGLEKKEKATRTETQETMDLGRKIKQKKPKSLISLILTYPPTLTLFNYTIGRCSLAILFLNIYENFAFYGPYAKSKINIGIYYGNFPRRGSK
jgi:hypothetical protein